LVTQEKKSPNLEYSQKLMYNWFNTLVYAPA